MNRVHERRVFYSYDKKEYFQIYSFTQGKDGSIYCKWPDFNNTKWVNFVMTNKGPVVKIANTPTNAEKLSLHGSGVVKFRQNDISFDPERIKGQFMLKEQEKQIAPRHLFTGLMTEPKYLPASKFANRKSDIEILASEHKPFVIVFFAIPQQRIPLKIRFNPIFDIDFFGENFGRNIGCDLFSLFHHDILWFAYKTQHISKWPEQGHVFYYDGVSVPLFIGRKSDPDSKHAAMVTVLQKPQYELQGGEFHITLPFPNPEDI